MADTSQLEAKAAELLPDKAATILCFCGVGGRVMSAKKALENCQAGADIIVVGNAIEKENSLIKEISEAVHSI